MKKLFSLIVIVALLCSCRSVKKSVVSTKETTSESIVENTIGNWVIKDSLVVNSVDSTTIDFKGITEVLIQSDGNISFKGESPKFTRINRSSEVINKIDSGSVEIQRDVLKDHTVVHKEKQVEKKSYPYWILIVLLLVAVFILYRTFK